MAHQQRDPGTSRQHPRGENAHQRASRIKHELDHRPRKSGLWVDQLDRPIFRTIDVTARRVNEHRRFPLAKLIKDAAESRISGIDSVGVGQNLKPNRPELVQRVVDLGQGPFRVGQREGGEEEEMLWMFSAYLGDVGIDLAC